ncbi:DUF4352 domain-containing protein [Cohnella caldifontis]|uniref:DUF4352 domain-containing protein n=1 Tax=Cohnella caldifontis TaxID=3027471 RepID=UPI0023EA858B|nr:DUF4352 domain-containing protein [Cohnella sp. YIM B05605]
MSILRKTKRKKPLVSAMVILLLTAALTACGPSNGSSSGASSVQAPANEADGSNSPETAKTYEIGETAELFGLKLTVDQVDKKSEFNQEVLQEGMEFILVKVTLENAGKEAKPYNAHSFELISSSGKPDLNVTTLAGEGQLRQGNLDPGSKVSGIIPFEHPKDDSSGKLTFQPNLMSDQKIVFEW